ncbi:MAG: hypothetical protein WBA68_10475, partial [Alteraurantiacibacter sp.]
MRGHLFQYRMRERKVNGVRTAFAGNRAWHRRPAHGQGDLSRGADCSGKCQRGALWRIGHVRA